MTLCECSDILTLKELLAVLRISPSQYYKLKSHGAFPIQPLPGLHAQRFSKLAVERYLQGQQAPRSLRRAG